MHAYLGTVVAAHNRTIVNQCHLASQTGCRHSSRHSGYSGSYHNKVILPCHRFFARKMPFAAPEGSQLFRSIRKYRCFLGSEVDGIAPSVKSAQIMYEK